MKNINNRPFTWTRSEMSNQDTAVQQINEIAEENGIEAFNSGGEQFADLAINTGLKPSDFTVQEFDLFKGKVANDVLSALMEIEREVFEFIKQERLERLAKSKK